MTKMEFDDARKKKLAKWFAVGVTIVVLGVGAPLIFSALQGLIGLIAFLLIGGTAIAFAPKMAMKFANWRIKGIKSEARKNPIETMQNVYAAKLEDWKKMRLMVEQFSTAVRGFEAKVRDLVREYPDQKDEYTDQLAGMQKLLQLRTLRLKEAKQNLDAFRQEIDKQQARYEVAVAALKAESAGRKFSDEEVYEQIKIDESFSSVQRAMDTAFAQLDSSLAELEYNPRKGATINLPSAAKAIDA